ncbi:MAG: hypothetical protein L0Z50_42430 [Verrucomicrobiales bacterium]|nr:hypothetical protein [Verrucomicrobiales bacterium]
MKQIHNFTRAALVLALGAATAALQAEPFLYVSDAGGSQLVKVDVSAGSTTAIGPFNESGCLALAIDPEGDLYTVTQGLPPWPQPDHNPRLARVDVATGNATPIGVNLSPEIFMGIGFTPGGTLYGVNAASGTADEGSLFRFDPATGTATKVKVTGSCGMIMDLAVHPDGTVYGVDPSSLFRINPKTGEATLVITTVHSWIMGLAIDDDGNFYISEILPATPLLRLDPVTGATTPVPGVTLNWPHGLEFIPTPRTRPVTLAFAKSPVTAEHWEGTVDTDGDGSPDGDLDYDQLSLRTAGSTVHIQGEYKVETDCYRFTAVANLKINLSTGSIRGSGVITDGWLDGAQIHLEASLVPGGSAGVLRLMPGSAD